MLFIQDLVTDSTSSYYFWATFQQIMNSYQLHSQTLPNNSSHLHHNNYSDRSSSTNSHNNYSDRTSSTNSHNNYSDRTSSTNSHTSSFQPHHNIVWRIVIHRNFFISFFITDFKTISSQQLHHNNFITNFHNNFITTSQLHHNFTTSSQ